MSVGTSCQKTMKIPRINLLEFDLDRIQPDQLMRWCHDQTAPQHIVTLNLNYLTLVQKLPKLKAIVKSANMTIADAMPLVRVAQFLNQPFPEKITGHDLVDLSAEYSSKHDLGVFLLGGGPGVAQAAADALASKYPGLRITGTDHGGFDADGIPEDRDKLVADIQEFRPHFLFVALGVPKQDYFIAAHREILEVPISAGIGCVFDVLAGRINRAPQWMQKASLEWLFQMVQEPKRLWKRFILGCIPTAFRLAWFAMKAKVFGSSAR